MLNRSHLPISIEMVDEDANDRARNGSRSLNSQTLPHKTSNSI